MKKYLLLISPFLALPLIFYSSLRAQIYSEAPITKSESGEILTDMIYIKFKQNDVIKIPFGDTKTDGNAISDNYPEIKQIFADYCSELNMSLDDLTLSKAIPQAKEEDTLLVDNITGDIRILPNLANVFIVKFSKPVDVEDIMVKLNKFYEVEYSHGPVQWINCSEAPNDPKYVDGSQWYLNTIQAPGAWGISKGSPDIKIAIIDGDGVEQTHEDLQAKIIGGDGRGALGPHGTKVAGFAGAVTNNGTGIASLGWNINLLTYRPIGDPQLSGLAQKIHDAVDDGADVINLSFRTIKGGLENCDFPPEYPDGDIRYYYWNWDYPLVADEIEYAIGNNVVIVASAGNNAGPVGEDFPCEDVPYPIYPAKYPSVISVSASQQDDNFVEGWNWDENNSKIDLDVNAPGRTDEYTGLWTTDLNNSYSPGSGTSYSAPQVSALSALLKSVNPSLTPSQIETILESTADKVGNYPYINGWNDHFGYGRINAYAALKYALENYGGTLTHDLTIPVGETWNFNVPGVQIALKNGASIIVEGTLNVQGSPSNKITFKRSESSGTWGSIIFDGQATSNSVIDNANIMYASSIQCLNGANITIKNSIMEYCSQGIYFYNSQPEIITNQIIEPVQNGINGDASGMSPLILHNTITKSANNPEYHHYQGIILANYTNGYIAHNDISGFMWGIYIGGGSDAYFTNYEHNVFLPNNRVRDNYFGICAGWGGFIWAGMWKAFGRNNSIYNISLDAKSYQYSTIYAQCNWWGTDGAQIYVDNTSTLDVSFPLTFDPWETGPPQKKYDMDLISVTNNYSTDGGGFNPDSSDLIGIYLEWQGRIEEAIIHYKQMVSNNAFPGFALGRLVAIKNRFNIKNIKNYFEILLNGTQPYKPIVMTLLAGILLGEDKYEQAVLLYNQIISQYPNTYLAVNALFEKFFATLNYQKDRLLAGQLLQELEALGLTEEEFLMRLQIAENLFNGSGSENLEKFANTNQANINADLPMEYSLLQNYPNPFNPVTRIKYEIPKSSMVSLKVYDVLGREVETLVEEFKPAGKYEVDFNAGEFPSGVYFYKLQSENFIKTKKMILIK